MMKLQKKRNVVVKINEIYYSFNNYEIKISISFNKNKEHNYIILSTKQIF